MILPTNYPVALVLLLVSLICWGSWTNTFKAGGSRWRFELFYFDFALGVLLLSVAACFTLGTLGSEMGFSDRVLVAGHTAQAWVFAGGVAFNFANMLLVAAIALVGMATAFPIAIGLALVIGVVWNYLLFPLGNAALLFGGLILLLIAVFLNAMAYRKRDLPMTATVNLRLKAPIRAKGIVVSITAGILMGAFYPMVEKGMPGDLGLGAYAAMVIFAIGVFLSTFVFNLYFLRFPLSGTRIPMKAYFRGSARQHTLGIAGGIIWGVGTLANFLVAAAPPEINVGPAVSFATGQCAIVISALWGLLVWKEFSGADRNTNRLIAGAISFVALGLIALALAPLFT